MTRLKSIFLFLALLMIALTSAKAAGRIVPLSDRDDVELLSKPSEHLRKKIDRLFSTYAERVETAADRDDLDKQFRVELREILTKIIALQSASAAVRMSRLDQHRSTNPRRTRTGSGSVSETNPRNLAGYFEIERSAGRQVSIDPRYLMIIAANGGKTSFTQSEFRKAVARANEMYSGVQFSDANEAPVISDPMLGTEDQRRAGLAESVKINLSVEETRGVFGYIETELIKTERQFNIKFPSVEREVASYRDAGLALNRVEDYHEKRHQKLVEKNAAREALAYAKENHRGEIDPVTGRYIMGSGDRFYHTIMGGVLIIAGLGTYIGIHDQTLRGVEGAATTGAAFASPFIAVGCAQILAAIKGHSRIFKQWVVGGGF